MESHDEDIDGLTWEYVEHNNIHANIIEGKYFQGDSCMSYEWNHERKYLKNPSKRIAKHQGSDFIDTENAVSISLNTPVDIKTSGTKLNAPIES